MIGRVKLLRGLACRSNGEQDWKGAMRPENARAFVANCELIKVYVSYLMLDNFSFQLFESCGPHVFFK